MDTNNVNNENNLDLNAVETEASLDPDTVDTNDADAAPVDADAVDAVPETPKKEKVKNPNRIVKGLFGTALAILILLTLISSILLAVRLVDYIKVDDNEIALQSNMDTNFDLFSASHVNEEGEVTVKSQNGESVIAPGTAVEYTIRLRNTDKMPLDVELIPNITYKAEKKIPIVVRMLTVDGDYIIGDAKTWRSLDDLQAEAAKCTLLKGESIEYVFQWKWAFESGDDAFDTELGATSVNTNLGISASFELHAEENTTLSESLKKGAPLSALYSGIYEIIFMIVVLVLLIAAIVLMVIIIIKKRPKKAAPPIDPADAAPVEDAPVEDAPVEGDVIEPESNEPEPNDNETTENE